jgi:hypothetical protein
MKYFSVNDDLFVYPTFPTNAWSFASSPISGCLVRTYALIRLVS